MAEELMRIAYHRSDNLVADSERIIETAQGNAYQAVNLLLVERNWLLGKRISEEIANGDGRTEYGSEVMKKLARALTAKYGRGFTMTNLYYYFSFYRAFPEIFHSLRGKSSAPLLSWTHYRTLLQVNDEKARQWYAQEAATENWSTRTLQRNISSQYYYRMLKTQSQDAVKREMQELTAEYQKKPGHRRVSWHAGGHVVSGVGPRAEHYQQPAEVPHGARQGVRIRRQTAAHPHRERRLLHRLGVLQLHPEVLRPD